MDSTSNLYCVMGLGKGDVSVVCVCVSVQGCFASLKLKLYGERLKLLFHSMSGERT